MDYLCHPLGDYCQNSNYKYETYYNSEGWCHQNGKLDLPCEPIPFYSMTNGVVRRKYTDTGGNTILEIETSDIGISKVTNQSIVIRYIHWKSCVVSEGDQVTIGQELGITGNEGQSSGTHLHVDMYWGDYSQGSNNSAVRMSRFESAILPYYDYHIRENETINNSTIGGSPIPIQDYYLYHIFTSNIEKVSINSSSLIRKPGVPSEFYDIDLRDPQYNLLGGYDESWAKRCLRSLAMGEVGIRADDNNDYKLSASGLLIYSYLVRARCIQEIRRNHIPSEGLLIWVFRNSGFTNDHWDGNIPLPSYVPLTDDDFYKALTITEALLNDEALQIASAAPMMNYGWSGFNYNNTRASQISITAGLNNGTLVPVDGQGRPVSQTKDNLIAAYGNTTYHISLS